MKRELLLTLALLLIAGCTHPDRTTATAGAAATNTTVEACVTNGNVTNCPTPTPPPVASCMANNTCLEHATIRLAASGPLIAVSVVNTSGIDAIDWGAVIAGYNLTKEDYQQRPANVTQWTLGLDPVPQTYVVGNFSSPDKFLGVFSPHARLYVIQLQDGSHYGFDVLRPNEGWYRVDASHFILPNATANYAWMPGTWTPIQSHVEGERIYTDVNLTRASSGLELVHPGDYADPWCNCRLNANNDVPTNTTRTT